MADDGEPDDEMAAKQAAEVKALLIDLQTAAYNTATTYTTIVIFGAYAGTFAIWSFTKEVLSQTTTLWVAALMGISMVSFVAFEVFKMIVTAEQMLKVRKLIVLELPPRELLQRRKDLAQEANFLVQRIVVPVWVFVLYLSITTGFLAAAMLLLAFFTLLASPAEMGAP